MMTLTAPPRKPQCATTLVAAGRATSGTLVIHTPFATATTLWSAADKYASLTTEVVLKGDWRAHVSNLRAAARLQLERAAVAGGAAGDSLLAGARRLEAVADDVEELARSAESVR